MGYEVVGSQSIAQLERLIRALALDPSCIVILPHAWSRMKQRQVTLEDVRECLQRGRIHQPPEPNAIRGNLEVRMTYYAAGRAIKTVVALDDNSPALPVITVIA